MKTSINFLHFQIFTTGKIHLQCKTSVHSLQQIPYHLHHDPSFFQLHRQQRSFSFYQLSHPHYNSDKGVPTFLCWVYDRYPLLWQQIPGKVDQPEEDKINKMKKVLILEGLKQLITQEKV